MKEIEKREREREREREKGGIVKREKTGEWKRKKREERDKLFEFYFIFLSEKSTYEIYLIQNFFWWSPQGVQADMVDGNIVVSMFKLQSCYYIHFQTNTLGKDMCPSPPALG